MPYGTHKLLGATSTAAAWKDWRTIQAWCEQNWHSELAAQHAPKKGAGHKVVDKRIEKLRVALGAPAGAWENVLDGLTPAQRQQQQQPDSQLPLEPRPSRSAEGQTYGVRVWQAYQALVDEMQTPDVPIHALHRRVGGDIHDLHQWLREQRYAHNCVPATGESAFSGGAARQSALRLPGEQETFLRVKLIDMSPMGDSQQPQQPQQRVDDDPFGTEGLTAEQKLLNVAKGVLKATALKRKQTLGRSDTYAGSLDQIALAARQLAEDLTAYLQQRERTPAEQYEYHLRQLAALKYPQEQRTAALTARIEATTRRRVADFTAECQARQQQAQQQELPPPQQDRGRGMEQSL